LRRHDLVFNRDAEIAEWVAWRIPHVRGMSFGPCTAIGVASGGNLIAGVVYHDWCPQFSTVQISIAASSPLWARRETIYALLHYPFRQAGAFKAWCAIPIDQKRTLKANSHIGFKREGVLAHHFGRGRHAVITRMLDPDFKRQYEE